MAKGVNSHVRKSYREEVLLAPFCHYCGTEEGEFHVDHIMPPQYGGMPTIDNFVKACKRCNSSKADRSLSNWLKHIEEKRDTLFHKIYGYSGRLRKFQRRHKQLDEWLHKKLFEGRKEHSRLSAIVGTLKYMING